MNVLQGNPTAKKSIRSILNDMFHPPHPDVRKFLNWKQNDESDIWAEKAAETLLKKLTKRKGALEELERALKYPGTPSKCVTIRKNMDGRVQIFQRKILPHVVSCRIWRWPDLQINNELEPVDYCHYAYTKNTKEICINPYHYERVEISITPSVLVPRYNFIPSCLPRPYLPDRNVPHNVVYSENGFSSHQSNSSLPDHFSSTECSNSECGQNYVDNYNEMNFPARGPVYGNNTNSDHFQNDQQCVSVDVQRVAYQEQQVWSSIGYYELNTRVGAMFSCRSPTVIVDGFTDPNNNSNRFCLGQLSNVKRTSHIEAVRKRIGEGVLLSYGGGRFHLRNLSNFPIFVESRNLNQRQNFHLSTVCKIPAGYSSPLVIFNNLEFAQMLSRCVYYGYDAVYELRKMCTIRVSFVKGWGKAYESYEITSVPCWIEIHLHGPLEWLDKVLTQMGGSANAISSMS